MKTGFWDAPRRDSQSAEDLFCSAFLLTNPNRNVVGLYQLNYRVASARIKWDELQLRTVMDRLKKHEEIDTEGSWVLVLSWWDHNNGRLSATWDEPIRKSLDGAPGRLLERWRENCITSGVDPTTWMPDYVPPPPQNEEGVGKELPHPLPPPEPQGAKQQPQQSNHNDQKTTTTIEVHYPKNLQLLDVAEHFRPMLLEISTKHELNQIQTQDLGWELSQRLQNQINGIGIPIKSKRSWLESLATQSRAGAQILDVGESLRETYIKKARKRASETENTTIDGEGAINKDTVNRNRIQSALTNASVDQIQEAIGNIESLNKPSKHTKAAIEAVSQRKLPAGFVGTIVIKAVDSLTKSKDQQ